MKRKLVSLLSLSLLMTCAGKLHAQGSNPEEIRVNIDFSIMSWDKPIDNLYYQSNGQIQHIPFVPNIGRSTVFTYKGAPLISFYVEDGVNENGSVRYKQIAELSVSPTAKKLLLLFIPKGDSTYQVISYPDSMEDFPVGSYKFVNLTSTQLAVNVGNNKLVIPPRGVEALSPKQLEDQNNVDIKLAKSNDEGGWEMAHSSRWGYSGNNRAICFVYEDPQTKKVIIRRINHKVPPPPPQPMSTPNS